MATRVVLLVVVAACSIPGGDFERGAPPGDGAPPDATGGVDASPPAPEFSSCGSLEATCGPDGEDSCCTSAAVPGGMFARGYDAAGDDGTISKDEFPATVSGFRLDKYEVTVGRFRAFVNAGMGTQQQPPITNAGARANLPGSGWDPDWTAKLAMNKTALLDGFTCKNQPTPPTPLPTWSDNKGNSVAETRPMNCITWYEAMAFCVWDGGYLPTEAEWNYAATGGDDQRTFPWSNPPYSIQIDPSRASYREGDDSTPNCLGDGMSSCAVTDLIDVGTKPMGDGRWGQSDLTGNVFEWVLDSRIDTSDSDPRYKLPCTDCAELTAAPERVVRGGSSFFDSAYLRASKRGYVPSGDRNDDVGVRCARRSSTPAAAM
jgi:formylglycine-generating enzyme required for sulfatase activity